MENIAITLPNKERYGAIELKEYIKKNTIRGIIVSLAVLIVALVAYTLAVSLKKEILLAPVLPIVRQELTTLKNDNDGEEMDAPTDVNQMVNNGPAARAGNPVPAPESEITADMPDFASTDVLDRASAEGGNGIDDGGFSNQINVNQTTTISKSVEEVIPDYGSFVAVEEDPAPSDLGALQRSVVYPDVAKKAGVEGKVTVAVYIDKYGKARKAKIVDSPNSLLDKAALEAVLKYTGYKPAIQNKQPVGCWLSIPINFKLR